jgi:glycine/D-amino acid oxidase-like deaminating enzyme
MVTAGGTSTVGSTFLGIEPDPGATAARLLEHGARFVPALDGAQPIRSRVCARPQSVDGRPFVGAVAGRRGIFVAAGHGPWGISIGPATAALAVDAILTDDATVPAELLAARPF